jgi:hypothetical protein
LELPASVELAAFPVFAESADVLQTNQISAVDEK